MSVTRRLRSMLALLAVLGAAGPGAAAEATAEDSARAFDAEPLAVVQQTLRGAKRVVDADGERRDKLPALRALSRELFDIPTMARVALAGRLDTEPAEKQRAFEAFFDEYIVRTYLQKLLFFRNPRFAYAPSEQRGDEVLVRTQIVTRKDEFYVDYLMREAAGRWLAVDVIVESISLVDNLAAQFASLLEREGLDELLQRMERKVGNRRDDDAREESE
jgi:phospholipid transport system substrate-binding protein